MSKLKISNDVIWHEFGHIFGNTITCCLGASPRQIVKYSFIKEDYLNPFIKSNLTDFLKNGDSFEIAEPRIKINLNTNNGFYYQTIVLLLGGIFQIKAKDLKPNKENFYLVYNDIDGKVSDNNIEGHAGCDYQTINNYLFTLDYPHSKVQIIEFAIEIFNLCLKFSLFEKLESIINEFNYNYNGTNGCGSELFKREIKLIKEILNDDFLSEIMFTINKLKTISKPV